MNWDGCVWLAVVLMYVYSVNFIIISVFSDLRFWLQVTAGSYALFWATGSRRRCRDCLSTVNEGLVSRGLNTIGTTRQSFSKPSSGPNVRLPPASRLHGRHSTHRPHIPHLPHLPYSYTASEPEHFHETSLCTTSFCDAGFHSSITISNLHHRESRVGWQGLSVLGLLAGLKAKLHLPSSLTLLLLVPYNISLSSPPLSNCLYTRMYLSYPVYVC